ncbi:MAG: ABC transporter permease [Oscillospiraceae bacterium]|nr:ABC transporter permease [Oscillospiraceae bacterium]MCD8321385.1 ABC transporter permease [Oscillospiraceae bacterium]
MFSEANVTLLTNIIQNDLLDAIGETLVMTFLPTLFAFIIGMPLGIILVTGEERGIRPLPKLLMRIINVIINLLRSVPFLILLVVVLPLSRLIVGTSVGTKAIIVPLTIAAFPFVARLVETSIREIDHGVIEAAQAMGASPMQIVWKVLIPEAKPSLLSNLVTALITIFGYGAMSGILGGGGIGALAINYGYYRTKYLVMYFMVILLIILVQIFQSVGNVIIRRSDKRIR